MAGDKTCKIPAMYVHVCKLLLSLVHMYHEVYIPTMDSGDPFFLCSVHNADNDVIWVVASGDMIYTTPVQLCDINKQEK